MTTATGSQVLPLIRLRWRMVRSRPKQVAIATLVTAFSVLVVGVVVGANRTVTALDLGSFTDQALVAYPAALLLFSVVAVVAPFLAGGAIELFPPAHLVAYPVSPRTRFTLSLLLMPFNLTWLLQVLLLAGLVAIGGAGSGRLWTLAGVTAAFVLAATAAGQALAWAGTAVRLTRPGRVITNIAAAALVVVVALNADQDALFSLADRSPLLPLLGSGLSPVGARWAFTIVLLLLLVLVARILGVLAVGWTLRLGTETAGFQEGALMHRHRWRPSPFASTFFIFAASVVRSRPIRRGLILLVVLPVVVAAVADLAWAEIVVIPGLVAAGAALLFGVNGFSLLGGGAAWLGSQPTRPGTILGGLALTILLVVTVTTAATTAGVATFAAGAPARPTVVALVGGALASIAWVTSTSLWLSVRSPYQADLRGNRDTPAPPGVMAGYSIRLAGTVGTLGLMLVAAAQLQAPVVAAAVTSAFLLASGLRLLWTVRLWSSVGRRSRAFMRTAFG